MDGNLNSFDFGVLSETVLGTDTGFDARKYFFKAFDYLFKTDLFSRYVTAVRFNY